MVLTCPVPPVKRESTSMSCKLLQACARNVRMKQTVLVGVSWLPGQATGDLVPQVRSIMSATDLSLALMVMLKI